MEGNKKTLIEKVAAAALRVGGFTPDKRNREQNYDYISADLVLERGGQALAAEGVVVFPSVTDQTISVTERQGKSPRIDAVVTFNMAVTDGENSVSASWFGCGSDYAAPDKALYKAITSGHKYFLMKLLNIGVGNEDGEHENEAPTPQPKPQPAQTAAESMTALGFDEPKPVKSPAERPLTPEALRDMIARKAAGKKPATMSVGATGALVGKLDEVCGGENARHAVCHYLTGKGSTKEMASNVLAALGEWANSNPAFTAAEAAACLVAYEKAGGQLELTQPAG